MPDRTITIPVLGEAHQAAFADSGTGSATAGSVIIVMPNGMTNADVRRAAMLFEEVARRDVSRATGI